MANTADALKLTYQTVYKAFMTIRLAILAQHPDVAARLLDNRNEPVKYCPNIEDDDDAVCLECRSPVFGVAEEAGIVRMQMLPGRAARDVFSLPLALKTWRTMVYCEATPPWDTLLFCCCKKAKRIFFSKFTDKSFRFDQGQFRSFSETWLHHYHCLSPEMSHLYIAELVLRFNIAEQEQFSILAKHLLSFVPKRND